MTEKNTDSADGIDAATEAGGSDTAIDRLQRSVRTLRVPRLRIAIPLFVSAYAVTVVAITLSTTGMSLSYLSLLPVALASSLPNDPVISLIVFGFGLETVSIALLGVPVSWRRSTRLRRGRTRLLEPWESWESTESGERNGGRLNADDPGFRECRTVLASVDGRRRNDGTDRPTSTGVDRHDVRSLRLVRTNGRTTDRARNPIDGRTVVALCDDEGTTIASVRPAVASESLRATEERADARRQTLATVMLVAGIVAQVGVLFVFA